MPIDPPSSPLPPLSNAPVANPVSPLPVYVPSVSEPQTSLPTFVPAASAPQTALPVPPALPSNGVPLEDRILALEQAYGAAVNQYVTTNDPRLTDAREWTAETISQAEAEAGTSTTRRAFTAQRVRQAIAAWWNTFSVAFRNFVANPTSDNFALLLTDQSGTGGGFVRSNGCTLDSPTINNLSANSLSQQTMALILTNEIVPSPPVAFFDDFLGDRASDLNWEVSANGGSDTNGPSGATNVFGLLQIIAPVNGFRQRILRAGPTIVNGIIIEACFAVPNLTDCGVSLGVQRPASGFDVGVVANAAVNNGQWTFQNGLGANTLITSIAPTAGDFITGKKYRVRIEFVSTTQVNIQILEADAGLTNWTQVFSGPVTTPSQDRGGGVSSHGTPRIGCAAGASGTRSVIVDWFRYRNSLNFR